MTKEYRNRVAPSRVGSIPAENVTSSMAEPGQPLGAGERPFDLDAWTDFHDAAAALPEEIREVFNLKWYSGLTHPEAALVLRVSERTIRSRWQNARLAIHRALEGRLPGI
jgi:DNA-directed RNA polymerase specialized sigma24 family protein